LNLISQSLYAVLQGLDQLVLGALSRIRGAVVAIGLVLFKDVIDRNQQAMRDRNHSAFVTPTRRNSAINRSKIRSLAAHGSICHLYQDASQPAVCGWSFARVLFARTLMIARTNPCPLTQMRGAGKPSMGRQLIRPDDNYIGLFQAFGDPEF